MTESSRTELRVEDIQVRFDGDNVRLLLRSEGGDRRSLLIPTPKLDDLVNLLLRAHLDASVAAAVPPAQAPEQEYRPVALTLHVRDLNLVRWDRGGAAMQMETVEGGLVVAAFMPDKIRFLRETLRKHFPGPEQPEQAGEPAPPTGPPILPGESPFQSEFHPRDGEGNAVDPMESVFPLFKRLEGGSLRFAGTGFFIANNGLFATARHILKDLDGDELPGKGSLVAMHFIPGDRVIQRGVVNYAVHGIADVGVGLLAKTTDPTGALLPSKPLVLSRNPPSVGDSVFTYAYPHTLHRPNEVEFVPRYYAGELTEEHPSGRDRVMLPGPCWRTSMVIHDGASGGPVFGRDGRVFGINSTGVREDTLSWVSRVTELMEVEIGQVLLHGEVEPRSVAVGELARLGHVLQR